MIEDMTVRGFKEDTRRDYVRNVRAFAVFIGRSPDAATAEDLRLYQLHQTQSGMQPPSINSAVSALRFFFTVTLDRPDLARRLTVVPQPRRIPVVLSVEEMTLLLQAASAPKYKAAFATAYGAGLRVSEVVALKVGDIDSERMLLRVERGKGGKDRHAMLSPQLLDLLRAWWREGRTAQPVAAGRLAVSRPQPGRAVVSPEAFAAHLAPLKRKNWFVYAKPLLLRAGSGACLSRPLHSSRRHRQQPAHCARRARRDIPLQGLPPQRAGAVPHNDARGRRVHQALSASRPTQGLPPHSPLRAACQCRLQGQHRPAPGS
jgi:integrase